MLDGRRAEFVELLTRGGARASAAGTEVDAAVDRLVHYAGWTDKLPAVFGSSNPISGPYFSYSAPEPTGVVAALAPTDAPLLGLVSVIAPIMAGGNACVVVAAEADAYVAITFGEVLATSDVPAGRGEPAHRIERRDRPAPGRPCRRERPRPDRCGRRAGHRAGAGRLGDGETGLPAEGHTGLHRFARHRRLRAFLEIKTVWHPVGALSLAGGSAY